MILFNHKRTPTSYCLFMTCIICSIVQPVWGAPVLKIHPDITLEIEQQEEEPLIKVKDDVSYTVYVTKLTLRKTHIPTNGEHETNSPESDRKILPVTMMCHSRSEHFLGTKLLDEHLEHTLEAVEEPRTHINRQEFNNLVNYTPFDSNDEISIVKLMIFLSAQTNISSSESKKYKLSFITQSLLIYFISLAKSVWEKT